MCGRKEEEEEGEEEGGGESDEYVTRMDAERLVKISKDNIPAGRSPGSPKIRWSDLILDLKRKNIQKRRRKERKVFK